MAISIMPHFPIPNRNKQMIRSSKDESGVIDIGWSEGVLSDGRVFRGEMWAKDGISMLTIFFSCVGIDALSNESAISLLEKEGLVKFRTGPAFVGVTSVRDDSENVVWAVNIVVGDQDERYVDDATHIVPYAGSRPTSLFNASAARDLSDARRRFVWEDGDLTFYSPEEARKAFPSAFEE